MKGSTARRDGAHFDEQRSTPVIWEGDVIIAGGGPAGIGAAIASAREGKKTLLVEKYGFLGGMCSYGSGMPLGGAYPGYKPIGGIAEEILARVRTAGQEAADVRDVEHFGFWYFHDSEYFRTLAADMVLASGAEIRLHSWVADVILGEDAGGAADGGEPRIEAVILESKNGREACCARVFIDATGDADLAALAGAPYERGRNEDGAFMAVTIPYILFDVDVAAFTEYEKHDPGFVKALAAARESGLVISTEDKFTSWHVGQRPGSIFSNIVRVRNIDGTSTVDLTRGEIEARRRIYQHLAFFRAFIPGCTQCYVGKSGEQVGVRDTRRILGQTILTARDCTELRKRSDSILRCAGPFDNMTRGNEFIPLEKVRDENDYYDIPYGCLVPKNVSNLLVAGRCFSADYLAQSGSRGMGLLMGMGHSAGTAATMLCDTGQAAKDLAVEALRGKLIASGMNV